MAVFNGPFFDAREPFGHTAPVVRKGRVYHNVGHPRWALAVREGPRGAEFSLLHGAAREQLRGFDWGSGNVQALIVEGRPTRLDPPGDTVPGPRSPPSQPDDCGPYPYVDYLKTARTSLAWRPGEFAFLLVTQSPAENEHTSFNRRRFGLRQGSGWDLADLQQFWRAYGAQGACNLDGGHCTQACFQARENVLFLADNAELPVPVGDPRVRAEPGVLLYPYVIERPSGNRSLLTRPVPKFP